MIERTLDGREFIAILVLMGSAWETGDYRAYQYAMKFIEYCNMARYSYILI